MFHLFHLSKKHEQQYFNQLLLCIKIEPKNVHILRGQPHCEHDEDPPALLPPPLLVPVVLLEDGAELQVGQHEPHRGVQGAGTGRLCNNY